MKFALASDVHLEFGPIEFKNTENADVLILSGDICVAKDLSPRNTINVLGENNKSIMYHDFFNNCCREFPHVVYVMGNHEHYHGDFAFTEKILRKNLSYLYNLHILEKHAVEISGVVFLGGTLWTDMNEEDTGTMRYISDAMNDFRIISNSYRKTSYKILQYEKNEDDTINHDKVIKTEFKERIGKLSPEDVVIEHKNTIKFIEQFISDNPNKKIVVVGHHAPTKSSIKPKYAGDYLMNGGYSSEMTEFITNNPQIKFWTHGHTHDNFDYMVGTTRVVCNPRGYINYESRADYFELKYYEV